MRLLTALSMIILMVQAWQLGCCATDLPSPPITEAPTCDCSYACSAYKGPKYDDCQYFCSYNKEPLPLCMCDPTYMVAKYRRVPTYANGTNPKTLSECIASCEPPNNQAGLSYAWGGTSCACRCPDYDEMLGYGFD